MGLQPPIAMTSMDRRLGAGLRRRYGSGSLGTAGQVAALALAPAFRLAVAALIVAPRTRRAGAEALVSGTLAALAARAARDRVGRPRPGPRTEGGFPSRHAAAAVAIARAAGRVEPGLRLPFAAAAAAGLAGRVLTGEHEPADIGAGAALGWVADRTVEAAVASWGPGGRGSGH